MYTFDQMINLNLPTYNFKVKSKENKLVIFDIIRKKHVVLTPEEWVRQHYINYLIKIKKYPESLIAVEKQVLVNKQKKRFDILVFNVDGTPRIIVECKAPNIKITQKTFDQIARYNLKLKADFLIVTNGLSHYYCQLNYHSECYIFLDDIPEHKKDFKNPNP